MLKQLSSLALTGGLLLLVLAIPPPARAQSRDTDPQLTEKVKAQVAAIGTGARVSVRMRDKQKLTGYVAEIGPQEFVVTVAREGTKVNVSYDEAREVKISNEKRLSTAGKILIVIGVLGILGAVGNGGG